MCEAALYAELSKSGTNLYGLVGTRIYPLKLPQSVTLPAITYQRVSTPRYHAFQTDTNLASPRMQIDIWGLTYSATKEVAVAVKSILQNLSGTMGAGSNTATSVAVILADESDYYENDTLYWRVRQDYTIYHKEG